MPDTGEKRELAVRQRDKGLAGVGPGDPEYDKNMSDTWGGPPPKWFDKAMPWLAKRYKVSEKVAIVTGGGGGIGFYLVKLLARCGFTVVVPARPGLEKETHAAVEAVRQAVSGAKLVVPIATLDLGSFASVRSFCAAIRDEQPCLDLLCLNAGRGGGRDDPREITTDGHEAIMQVNAIGHFLLAHELFPLLRASSASRIVSQSSGARFQAKLSKVDDLDGTDCGTFSGWDQYCLSKAVLALFTVALNERLVAAGVDNVIACVSEPGLTSTGVNIQHDLVKSVGLTRLYENTNQMHDAAGHHAADGSLPMALASVDRAAGRNAYYTTDGNKATALLEATYRHDPTQRRASQPHENPATDPLNESAWPKMARDSFWKQAVTLTGASWDAIQPSKGVGSSAEYKVLEGRSQCS